MRIRFLHEASLEFLDIISSYETEVPGLGRRFLAEFDKSLRWLRDNPESCRLTHGGYRRMTLRVFPYQIVYVVRDHVLWIIAVGASGAIPNIGSGGTSLECVRRLSNVASQLQDP
jgi:hypothetical protein